MSKQLFRQRFTHMAKLSVMSTVLMLGFSSYVHAQSPGSAEQAYQEAMQECEQISNEDQRKNCQRDAAAALQEARKNPDKYKILDEQVLLKNRTARCDGLPAGQRELCIQNMQEADNTEITGSVVGGGMLRRTTITEHGESYTVPVSELPENYQNDPTHRITIKKADETQGGATTDTGTRDALEQERPTSNAPAPLKAKEEYGAHPVRPR
ncbi:MAG TPA: hypothetical protein VK082_03900 [Paenalcaligenes sp.]|nr:hypothetical protein [Paenalcaligenes sp.]